MWRMEGRFSLHRPVAIGVHTMADSPETRVKQLEWYKVQAEQFGGTCEWIIQAPIPLDGDACAAYKQAWLAAHFARLYLRRLMSLNW